MDFAISIQLTIKNHLLLKKQTVKIVSIDPKHFNMKVFVVARGVRLLFIFSHVFHGVISNVTC